LFAAGRATEPQSIFWHVPKAVEELYDLESDRDEVRNLAESPEHQTVLQKLRAAQRQHLVEVRDICFLPETELHARSSGSTPYQLARDSAKYPLERILEAAALASNLESDAVPNLSVLLTDSDSAVRYWGAMGLLMRGKDAVTPQVAALEKALADESPAVRIVAAQALAEYASPAALARALDTLGALAPPQKNNVLVAMSALAAIEALGEKAAPLHPAIASMNPNGPSPDARYNSYVPRLIANIVSSTPGSDGKAKGKAKAAPGAKKAKL
jgi:uncharacterized sulfatase